MNCQLVLSTLHVGEEEILLYPSRFFWLIYKLNGHETDCLSFLPERHVQDAMGILA